ncbi:hypothetical protein V8C40DRAFT_246446 [Trichoderma camerunense]
MRYALLLLPNLAVLPEVKTLKRHGHQAGRAISAGVRSTKQAQVQTGTATGSTGTARSKGSTRHDRRSRQTASHQGEIDQPPDNESRMQMHTCMAFLRELAIDQLIVRVQYSRYS